jgi:hypothetical protein
MLPPRAGSSTTSRLEMVKIVTYNVNGLRPRVAQHGSLRRLLDALDADIICFQVRPIASGYQPPSPSRFQLACVAHGSKP